MKKPLVSAIAAALAFTACEDPPRRVSAPSTAPSPVIVSKAPVASSVDSGVPLVRVEEPKPIDPLALAHDTSSVDHLARSRQLLDERDVKGALAEARRALFSNPGDPDVLEQLAKASRQAGQPQLAAEALGRLAQQRPTDAVVCIKQARALLSAKDFAGAITAGQEAAMRDPGNPEAFQVTGLAQLSLGELGGAITSFQTVIALQPDHGYAMNNLGLAYLRSNQNEKAVEVLEEAVEKLPTVAWVHNNLGVAYERVGRSEEARHAYQEAMDLSPKYVKAKLNAARVAQRPVDVDGPAESMTDVPHPLPETAPSP